MTIGILISFGISSAFGWILFIDLLAPVTEFFQHGMSLQITANDIGKRYVLVNLYQQAL